MAKTFNRSASLLLAASLFVAAPTVAQDYAPSFPRDGAKKILDNDHVTVWDVSWNKGTSTAMQERRFDQISVTLTEGAVKVTRPDKTSTIEQTRFASVHFESKGTVAAEEGVSDKPRRAIVVEMKSYAAPKLDPTVVRGLQEAKEKGIPDQFPRQGAAKLFENDRVTVWDATWPSGPAETPLHVHYTQGVGVFVEAGALGETTVRHVGEVIFSSPRAVPHSEAASQGPPRAIFVKLK